MRRSLLAPMSLAACCFASLGACASTTPRYAENGSQYGDVVISAQQIDAEHAPNAWELLRQLVPRYSYVEDRSGRAISINGHRGRSSISLANSESPIVVVEGRDRLDRTAQRIAGDEHRRHKRERGRDLHSHAIRLVAASRLPPPAEMHNGAPVDTWRPVYVLLQFQSYASFCLQEPGV
jgi:hypothetical protein